MRFLVFITLAALLPFKNLAQDTIVKKSGEKILAKVVEVSTTDVKFKKFAMLDGPTYIESKTDISQVIYSNGMKDVFAVEAPKKIETLKVSDPDADYYSAPVKKDDKIVDLKNRYHYQNRSIGQKKMQVLLLSTKDKEIGGLVTQAKQAKNRQIILGFSAIPLGIASLVCLGSGSDAGVIASGICFAGAVSCPIFSGIQRRKKVSFNSKAIALYNQKY